MDSEEKYSPLVNAVPLLEAVLCADCEVISDSHGESCSVCGSRSLMSVARVLGGSAGTVRAIRIDLASELRSAFKILVNPDAPIRVRTRRLWSTRVFEKSGT